MAEKILYCSDLHIDRAPVDANTIAQHINKQIKKEKCKIVVFAGDVSDSLHLTYSFLSLINAKCLFVKGNHDHYKKEESKLEAPDNVVLLENSFYETDHYIFLGATLWTGLGYSHHSIETKKLSFNRLIDSLEIQDWSVEEQLKQNKESRCFFEEFLTVRNYFKTSAKYDKDIQVELSQPEVCIKKIVALVKSKFSSYLEETIEKAISSLDKKIVCISHHAPFIEEFLVHQAFEEEKPYYNNKLLQPQALDALTPHELYSMQIGRTPFDENPLEIYAYFNCEFNPHFDENIVWVHGHTHQIREVHTVKGINIHCNPSSCRYFDWSKQDIELLKPLSFKQPKVDAKFKQLSKSYSEGLNELFEKITRLQDLKWADRKTSKGIDKIVFLNTIDSLRLSCDQLFEELNSAYLILKICFMQGASFSKFQRLWSKYSSNTDIYDIFREIEANVQNIKYLSEALYIAKNSQNFHFIMGGLTPKKLLQLNHKFLHTLNKQ